MSRVGLHLRVDTSLVHVAQQAIDLSLPFFQSFVVRQVGKRFAWPTRHEEIAFRALCEQHFTTLFAHGSFWINLAHTQRCGAWALKRELACAKRLGFTHLVVHSGCATGAQDRTAGIDAVVRTLNKVLRHERDITLVLENTAHGNLSVGSDILDFVQIREKLEHPERVRFCVDTAHAYAYGYALGTQKEVDSFVHFLDETLDVANIALIHLNDTCDDHGSRMDRHALLGEGTLGVASLKQFIEHKKLRNIPVILEPPVAPTAHIVRALDVARQWQG